MTDETRRNKARKKNVEPEIKVRGCRGSQRVSNPAILPIQIISLNLKELIASWLG